MINYKFSMYLYPYIYIMYIYNWLFNIFFYLENNPLLKIYSFATSGNDEVVKIWEILYEANLKEKFTNVNRYRARLIHELKGHESAVTTVRYNTASDLLASSGLDKTIRLWCCNDNRWECVNKLESHCRYINAVAFSKDGNLLASGNYNSIN